MIICREEGDLYPYAEHINTICNEKILEPFLKDFNGKFVVEESYYGQMVNAMLPTSFSLLQKEDGIVLYSYEIPEGEKIKVTFFHMIL